VGGPEYRQAGGENRSTSGVGWATRGLPERQQSNIRRNTRSVGCSQASQSSKCNKIGGTCDSRRPMKSPRDKLETKGEKS